MPAAVVGGAKRGEADADPAGAPHLDGRGDHLEQEPGAPLGRTAVVVGPLGVLGYPWPVGLT